MDAPIRNAARFRVAVDAKGLELLKPIIPVSTIRMVARMMGPNFKIGAAGDNFKRLERYFS